MGTNKKNKNKPLTIGAFYGPEEKEKEETTKIIYSELTRHMIKIKRTDKITLAGDFNAKFKIDNPVVRQNESRNGIILEDLIQQTNVCL